MQIKTYVTMDYDELEELVCKEYGWEPDEWNYVADQEATNDTSKTFIVNGELSDWEIDELADIKKGIGHKMDWKAHLYLNDLATKGVIPKGEYLIEVSW